MKIEKAFMGTVLANQMQLIRMVTMIGAGEPLDENLLKHAQMALEASDVVLQMLMKEKG